MLGKIFNKIKAAVPKVINAISKKVKEVVNDVCERNERIVEKVKEAAKNTSLYLERGTVTIGAVGPYNKKNHIILDFLFQVKDAVVEEYPILTWPNDKLKQGIGYAKDAFATGEKQVGGLIYDLDIPIVSDFVGAFTGVREPGAESNRASIEGAIWRGFVVKGAGGTLEGLATFLADPLEAVEGINKFAAYPEEMAPPIWKGVADYWDTKIVNGSPEDRAEVCGQAFFEIASMFIGVGEAKAATKVASTGMDVAQMADKVSDVAKAADKISDVAKVTDKVSDVAKVADKAVDLGRYQASLKGLGKKLAQNIDDGILTQGRAFSDSIDNLISAMNKHTSTPYPAYAGLGKLDDVGKTADKFEDWYSSVKKSMMKTDTPGGSGVKVSGPVDELNPKALNEAGEQIAKGADKSVKKTYRNRIDEALAKGDIDAANDIRYERYCKEKTEKGKVPKSREEWDKLCETINNNRTNGYANEPIGRDALNDYLDNHEIVNNNQGEILTHTVEGRTVRPDSIGRNAEGQIDLVHDHKHFTGQSQDQVLYNDAQIRAERDMLELDVGGKHVVTISSEAPNLNGIPPQPRPSISLGELSDIYYVDPVSQKITHQWKVNDKLPGGGFWKKV